MSLSLLCVTNNEYNAEPFVRKMRSVSKAIGAEFVIGLDREKAQNSNLRNYADNTINLQASALQEDVLDSAIAFCSGEWVFRMDDDETLSPALVSWLKDKRYKDGSLYTFPRIYLYPNTKHFVTNDEMFPDKQTRLGKKEYMYGCNYVHAGNRNGPGEYIPCAIEHHKLLVRTLEQRKEIAARYEKLKVGAGSYPQYARYNLPEMFYRKFEVKEYRNNGNFSAW